jgi:hypothetical protein
VIFLLGNARGGILAHAERDEILFFSVIVIVSHSAHFADLFS